MTGSIVRLHLSKGNRVQGQPNLAADVTDQRHALADLRKISKRLLRSQDEERRRIARELHDSTTQHLVAAGIGLTRLGMICEDHPEARLDRGDVQDILAETRNCISEAQHEIRALSYLLHPPALDKTGLGLTLRRFVAGFARRTRIEVALTVQDDFVCRSDDIATTLLRIVQEALINVYRHAEATRVEMRLMSAEGLLVLEIEDDGKGVAPNPIGPDDDIESIGVGIPGMRARLRQFHGDLQILPGRCGALIRATIPLRASRLD
jgi:two-component system NarL family sensor kinase